MDWNYDSEELYNIIFKYLILFLSNLYEIKITKIYIYKNFNKFLKHNNIYLKKKDKIRSVNYYIKRVYKTWDNFFLNLNTDIIFSSNNYIMLCK
uniref:Uncharacterized protein n=1 Tax=viral metagenome TaxID=1070528 RepID=A0A6C0IY17_9ZZZZ